MNDFKCLKKSTLFIGNVQSRKIIYKVTVNNCIEIYEIIPNVYVKLYFNDQVKAKSKVAFKTSNENG
jgi:hypothetical protein